MGIYRSGDLGEEGERLADMIKKETKPSAEFLQKLEKCCLERDSKQVKKYQRLEVTV